MMNARGCAVSEACEECGGDMGGFHFFGCSLKRKQAGAVSHSPALSIPEPGRNLPNNPGFTASDRDEQ